MKQLPAIFLLSILHISSASADFIGFTIGGGIWNHSPSGTIRNNGSNINDVNLEDNLGLSGEAQGFAWVSVEHPVPLVPNVEVRYSTIDLTGNGTVNAQFSDTTFTGNISDTLTLNQYDAIIYYEILDNWVNLDLGVSVKYIDGSVTITSSTITESQNFTAPIPMAYAKAKFDLPFSGFSASGKASLLSFGDHELSDYEVSITYETDLGLGAGIGYRKQTLKLDDIKQISSNISIDGLFANLFYHF